MAASSLKNQLLRMALTTDSPTPTILKSKKTGSIKDDSNSGAEAGQYQPLVLVCCFKLFFKPSNVHLGDIV